MARHKTFDREAALDRALRLFWRRGYNGTSVQDLVEHLGINRGSLYDTFGDKQQLYRMALERYQERTHVEVTDTSRSGASPGACLRAILQDVVKSILADTEQKGCFLVNATTELATVNSNVNRIVLHNAADFERELTQLLAAGQQTGEFRADLDPAQGAVFLQHLVNGMRVQAKISAQRPQLEGSVELALRALGAGV